MTTTQPDLFSQMVFSQAVEKGLKRVERKMKRPDFSASRFNGSNYQPKADDVRLRGQIKRIYGVMKDCGWRTLGEIEALTGDPPASISAQLRHLRKPRFGGFEVNKRARGLRDNGLFEYQVKL